MLFEHIYEIQKTNHNPKMANLLDKVKQAGKNVVDAGAKTMLKVRNSDLFVAEVRNHRVPYGWRIRLLFHVVVIGLGFVLEVCCPSL